MPNCKRFFSRRFGGLIGSDFIRSVAVFITIHTSTSYAECLRLPLTEMCEIYDDITYYLEKVNEKMEEGS